MKTTLDSRPGRAQRAVPGRPRGQPDLLDDLGRRQVALQPTLPGGAERAGHPAAGLAGHAQGDPVRVAHQHRLDQRAVVGPPQRLAGVAVVAGQRADLGQQFGQQRVDELGAGRRPAGRSSRRHPGSARRSSAGPAGRPGTPAGRRLTTASRRCAGSRSARCTGGMPRRGAVKIRGSGAVIARTSLPRCAATTDRRTDSHQSLLSLVSQRRMHRDPLASGTAADRSRWPRRVRPTIGAGNADEGRKPGTYQHRSCPIASECFRMC